MKGRDTFTSIEIDQIKEFIVARNGTSSSGQKLIRQKMRNLGFFGLDDWGIRNLQTSDLDTLIESGKIVVSNNSSEMDIALPSKLLKIDEKIEHKNLLENNLMDLEIILQNLKNECVDPSAHSEKEVEDAPGNYMICLKKNSKLPITAIVPIFSKFEGLQVVYTGIAGISLRTRDYKQHFNGNNSGRSTLRKSLGVLFGYKKILRDKDFSNRKTKFNIEDEEKLSEWMQSNLVMFTLSTRNFNANEIKLINHFNPPLNLKCNYNSINFDFRRHLSTLRNSSFTH